jgi:hypothetical protein
VRVREDDSVTGIRTWSPFEVRVVEGPYIAGTQRQFIMDECEPGQGGSRFDVIETIQGIEPIDALGKSHDAQRIQHERSGHRMQWSWYVLEIGEVLEVDAVDGTTETLVAFEPGFADCP